MQSSLLYRPNLIETERVQAVAEALVYLNHKSAKLHSDIVTKLLKDKVQKGWMLILPIAAATRVKGLRINPLGVTIQSTINKTGKKIQSQD